MINSIFHSIFGAPKRLECKHLAALRDEAAELGRDYALMSHDSVSLDLFARNEARKVCRSGKRGHPVHSLSAARAAIEDYAQRCGQLAQNVRRIAGML